MDSKGPECDGPSVASSTTVIGKIHSMQWLKSDSRSLNLRKQPAVKILRSLPQKTEVNDYFSGTKGEKKRRERKSKIETFDDIETSDAFISIPSTSKLDSFSKMESSRSDVLPVQSSTMANVETVWNKRTNVADTLFPNTQSVRVEYFNEEEMMSIALAESIMSAQLEQYRLDSVDGKKNITDRPYDDSDSDDDWGNVRRNLPASPEATVGGNNFSMQNKCRNSNNDNKVSAKSESHCNERRRSSSSRSLQSDLDWYRKTKVNEMASEPSAVKKSVSFVEPLTLEHVIEITNENCQEEIPKKLNGIVMSNNREKVNNKPLQLSSLSSALSIRPKFVDKYGRVDGYTERHLFMGRGGRLKEQEYLKQHGFVVGIGNVKCKSSKKDSQNAAMETYKREKIEPKKVELQKSNNNTKYQNHRNSVCDRARDGGNRKEKGSKNCQVSQGSKEKQNEKQNVRNTRHCQDDTESKVEKALSTEVSASLNVCTNDRSSLTESTRSNDISNIGLKAVDSDLKKSLDSNSLDGSTQVVQFVNSIKNYEQARNNVSKTLERCSQSTDNGFDKIMSENARLVVEEQQRYADVDNDVINSSKMSVTVNCSDKSKKDRVEGGSLVDVAYFEKCSNNVTDASLRESVDQSVPYYFQTMQDLKNVQHSQDITFNEHLPSLNQSSVVPDTTQYQSSASSYLQYFNASPHTQNLMKQNVQYSSVPIVPCSNSHIQSQIVAAVGTGCQNVYAQDRMQYENLHPSDAQCFDPKNNNLQRLTGKMDNVEKYTTETNVSVQSTKHLNVPLRNVYYPSVLSQNISNSNLPQQDKRNLNSSSQRVQNPNLLFQNTHPDPSFETSWLSNVPPQNFGNIGCLQHPEVLLQNTKQQCLPFLNVRHPNVPLESVQRPNNLVLQNIQHPYLAMTTNVNVQSIETDRANLQVDYFIDQKQGYPGTISNYANSVSTSVQGQQFQNVSQRQQSTLPYSFYRSDVNSDQNLINFHQDLPSSNIYVQDLPPVTDLNRKRNNVGTGENTWIPEYKEGQCFNYLKDVKENSILSQNLHNLMNIRSDQRNIQVESSVDRKKIILNTFQGSLPSFRTSKEQNLIAEASSNVDTMQSPYRVQGMTNLFNVGSEIQTFSTSNVQSTACNKNKNLCVQDDRDVNQNWKNCNQRKQIYSSMRQDQSSDSRVTKITANLNAKQINTGLEDFRIQKSDSTQPVNCIRKSKTSSSDTDGHFNVNIGIIDKPDADEEQRQCNIPPMVSPLSCMNFGIHCMKQIGSAYNSPSVLNTQLNSTENVNPNFGQGMNNYGFFA